MPAVRVPGPPISDAACGNRASGAGIDRLEIAALWGNFPVADNGQMPWLIA